MSTLQEIRRSGMVVIYSSPNGRTNWQPVKPDAVPDWVRNPHTLGRLVRGEEAMDCAEGTTGSAWYRAIEMPTDTPAASILALAESLCS